jgi:hypothetical protein
LPRKKKPSQVAQVETPRPRSRVSDSSPSQIAEAPVAMITLLARNEARSVETVNGRRLKSTETASSSTTSAPNRSACARKWPISSGPSIPSGKPG